MPKRALTSASSRSVTGVWIASKAAARGIKSSGEAKGFRFGVSSVIAKLVKQEVADLVAETQALFVTRATAADADNWSTGREVLPVGSTFVLFDLLRGTDDCNTGALDGTRNVGDRVAGTVFEAGEIEERRDE